MLTCHYNKREKIATVTKSSSSSPMIKPTTLQKKDLSTMEITLVERKSKREYFRCGFQLDLNNTLADLRRLLQETRWYKQNITEKEYSLLFIYQDVTTTREMEHAIMLGNYSPRCATMSSPMRYMYNLRDTLTYIIFGELQISFVVMGSVKKKKQKKQTPTSSNSPKVSDSEPTEKDKEQEEEEKFQDSPLVPRHTAEESLLINFEPFLYTQSLMDSHKKPASSFLDQDSPPMPYPKENTVIEKDEEKTVEYEVI